MTHSPPFISTGDSFLDISDDEKPLLDEIGKIVLPIFEKSLKESTSNQVRVGCSAKDKYDFLIFTPHNYRRWYEFLTKDFTPPTRIKELKRRGVVYKSINYNSEHFFENYLGCNIKVKKRTIEIQNLIENNRAYAIDMFRADEQLSKIVYDKELLCIKIIKEFIKEFGGFSTFKLVQHKGEYKFEHSAITEKLEPKETWHTKNHKKVYSTKEIELYSLPHAIEFINSSLFYRYNPEIASPLKSILKEIQRLGSNSNITPDKSLQDPSVDFYNEIYDIDSLKKIINTKADVLKYKDAIINLPEDENFEMLKYLYE